MADTDSPSRNRLTRRGLLAGGAAALVGCATGVPPQAIAGLRQISLVTAFDPTLTLRFYGVAGLDNELATGSLDLGLGSVAADATRALLVPRFEVVSVEHRPQLLVERQRAHGLRSNLPDSALTEALLAMPPRPAGDAVLLLASSWGQVPTTAVGAGNTAWYGSGLTQYARGPSEEYNSAYARVAWRAVLLRAADFAVIGRQDAWAPGRFVSAPWRKLSFRWDYANGASLPPAQAAELTEAARAAVVESVPETLTRLGLLAART